MSDREKTCAQRIHEHMQSREEDARRLLAAHSTGEEDDEFNEESIYDYGLSVSTYKVIRYDLSTGGPGDWLEAKLDSDGDVQQVSYHFADWWDHAEEDVPVGSPLWELMEWHAEIEQAGGY